MRHASQLEPLYHLLLKGYQLREAFILTQAPKENTVEDFWRMIWEYEVFSIVMLSSADEHDEVCL